MFALPRRISALLLCLATLPSLPLPGLSPAFAAEVPRDADPTAAIDALMQRAWQEEGVEPSPRCSDVTFLRRVYLDVAGRIPTLAETANFLSASVEDKRERLVDLLLASENYARHMRDVFDVVLMGRKGPDVQRERQENGWLAYLENAFRDNRPWDQTVREILLARPTGEADRGAVWFLYERDDKHQEIAEAVAASLFGVQIQCAQCHDHLSAFEIEQRHYWGLVAFFNRGKNVRTPEGPRVAESAIGGFAQFTDLSGDASDALLTFLGTDDVVEEDRPADGEEQEDNETLYITHDESGQPLQPRVPKFSRRQALVDEIVAGNPLIARAMVNRVWALLLGRGLVHPVDEMDSMHEPSHPELLDWLAADFERSGYDIKRLVRAIVLSRPYQLDGRPVGSAADESTFAWALQKPLSAEALYRSMLIAVDGSLAHEDAQVLSAFAEVFPKIFPEEKVSELKQSLFLSNNEAVQQICAVRPQSTLEQLLTRKTPGEQIELAYNAAFQRPPDEEELAACTTYLESRTDRPQQAIRHLMWALLTSAEFRFNH